MSLFGKPRTSSTRVRMHWPIAGLVCILCLSCIAAAFQLTPLGNVLVSNGDNSNIEFDVPDVADTMQDNDNVKRTYTFKYVKYDRTVRVLGPPFGGTSVSGTSPGCAPGFTHIDAVNGCYMPVAKASTWDEAASVCKAANSHLVFIDSSQEQQAVATLVAAYTDPVCYYPPTWAGYSWWIGVRRIRPASTTFVAKSGSTAAYDHPMSYFNWMSGEPNGINDNENCVHLAGSSRFTWNDLTCDTRLCFVCEVVLQ